MSYRPITDMWILARAKLLNGQKYYGAYLGGFPERARKLLGCTIKDPVLHVCGGHAKDYPYKGGFGPNDKTLDYDANLKPDIRHDIRQPFLSNPLIFPVGNTPAWHPKAYLCDPPYSPQEADNYSLGSAYYPAPSLIIKNCFDVMEAGQRVGIIHYIVPKAPKNSIFVACVGVICGFNNRIRVYSVFEKT